MTDDERLRQRVLQVADRVRILKHSGKVLAYGRMPNTETICWYLYGYKRDLLRMFEYENQRSTIP